MPEATRERTITGHTIWRMLGSTQATQRPEAGSCATISVPFAAFSVSDLESNRLAGIKLLNWSNLCTHS